MKLFRIINIAVVFVLIFISCDSTTDVEIQIPYENYYIIDGNLINGVPFEGLTIKSTMPLDKPYSDSLADVNDAVVYLKLDGLRVIPLSFAGSGKYIARYSFTPSAGQTYELHGSIGEKTFYSKTIIPSVPIISNIVYDYQSNYYLIADVKPIDNEVYGAAWVVGDTLEHSSDFYSITGKKTGDIVKVRTEEIPTKLRITSLLFKTYIQVYAFDPVYLEYFSTKERSKPIDNLTLQGGTVKWNITGDHMFGLFIGMAKTKLTPPKL